MRADKHYVEMLDAPPAKTAASEPALPAAGAAGRETSAGDAEATAAAVQAGRDLAQSLAALRASTNLLSGRGPALASSVAGNLIRAEAWRSTCLLHVSRFLRGEITAKAKPVRVQSLIDQVLESIEPERRLRNLCVDVRASVGDSIVVADEELLVYALSGLLMSTIGLDEEPEFTVTIAAEARKGEVAIAIAQEQFRPSSNWASEWPASGAARILATCNGRLATAATATGSEIRLVLPRSA